MRRLVLIAALAVFLALAPLGASAQDMSPPVPDSAYAPDQMAAAAAVPMPDSDPGGDGSVVVVPIPGGGTVRVEGPNLPAQTNSPPPIEPWGEHMMTPNAINPSPVGP
jgi:hypothetical protein